MNIKLELMLPTAFPVLKLRDENFSITKVYLTYNDVEYFIDSNNIEYYFEDEYKKSGRTDILIAKFNDVSLRYCNGIKVDTIGLDFCSMSIKSITIISGDKFFADDWYWLKVEELTELTYNAQSLLSWIEIDTKRHLLTGLNYELILIVPRKES